MIVTYERASKQAGWKGDEAEDRVTVRGFRTDGEIEVYDFFAELVIEIETFDMIGEEARAVKVTIFGDAVELLQSGRVVQGIKNLAGADTLDEVEDAFAVANVSELIRLSEKGKPRIIDNSISAGEEQAERDGAACAILGAALLNKPAIMGAVNERAEREIEAVIKRANEVAETLGYPDGTVKSMRLDARKGPGDDSTPPIPGGFTGGGSNMVH